MNSITIIGNLTKDAVTRQAGESKVTAFSIAENKRIKGDDVTIFYDCSLWGDRGERIAQYLLKGGQVAVIGELMPPREKDGRFYLDVRVIDVSLPVRKDAAPAARTAAPASSGYRNDEIPF